MLFLGLTFVICPFMPSSGWVFEVLKQHNQTGHLGCTVLDCLITRDPVFCASSPYLYTKRVPLGVSCIVKHLGAPPAQWTSIRRPCVQGSKAQPKFLFKIIVLRLTLEAILTCDTSMPIPRHPNILAIVINTRPSPQPMSRITSSGLSPVG